MKPVLVDTSGFYAALNRKDAAHREARRLFSQAREERWSLFATNCVVAETHALSLIRRGRNYAWQFLQSIYAGSTNVVRVEERDEGEREGSLNSTKTRILAIAMRLALQ